MTKVDRTRGCRILDAMVDDNNIFSRPGEGTKPVAAARLAREAEALRRNLWRRKEQQRMRQDRVSSDGDNPKGIADTGIHGG